MDAAPGTSAIDRAHAALAGADWAEAERRFREALDEHDSADAHEGLSWAAWYRDENDLAIASREAAYRLYRRSGDRAGAARMAIWTAVDYLEFRGAPAVASGWLARAERLLEGLEPKPEHGWLHLHRGAIALEMEGDVSGAQAHADAASEIATTVGDIDIELIAISLRGLSLVAAGDIASGMPLLDEAAAAALAGEFSTPVAVGWARCYVIYGCEFARDHDRAAQWAEETSELAERLGLRYLFSVCRTHMAGAMVGYGAWAEAERELQAAIDQLSRTRPGHATEGIVRLAELRRRQGRLEEAASLFEDAGDHPLAAAGLAALALDRGDVAGAEQITRTCLEAIPVELRALRSHPLELMVCSRAALDDTEGARSALRDLMALSAQLGTPHLAAISMYCEAVVASAEGDHEAARTGFRRALASFAAARAPYEEAITRGALARELEATGDAPRAAAEAARAQATLERLRRRPSGRHSDGPLTERETAVLRCVATGLSDAQIAKELVISQHTVHRHIANIRTKLRVSSRAAAVAKAAEHDLL